MKDRIADIVYLWYRLPGRKPTVKVYGMDETLDELLHTGKSLVRFGDGEIVMMKGKSLKLQQASPELAEGLKRILGYNPLDPGCAAKPHYTVLEQIDAQGLPGEFSQEGGTAAPLVGCAERLSRH